MDGNAEDVVFEVRAAAEVTVQEFSERRWHKALSD